MALSRRMVNLIPKLFRSFLRFPSRSLKGDDPEGGPAFESLKLANDSVGFEVLKFLGGEAVLDQDPNDLLGGMLTESNQALVGHLADSFELRVGFRGGFLASFAGFAVAALGSDLAVDQLGVGGVNDRIH